jgi:hypothetical protein
MFRANATNRVGAEVPQPTHHVRPGEVSGVPRARQKEKTMKSGKLISAIALLVALAIPVSLAAQEHHTQHHRYRLIDVGTLGGHFIIFNFTGAPNTLLNSKGQLQAARTLRLLIPTASGTPIASLSMRSNGGMASWLT